MRILIVEDDRRILDNLSALLTKDTYAVDLASTYAEGSTKAFAEDYDLIIVDWMLQDGDGTALIASFRREDLTTPVLLLTAKSQKSDVVEGLNAGADDYVIKPYDAEILRARVRALIRRQDKPPTLPLIVAGNLQLDLNAHEVTINRHQLDLTPKEYAVLEYLALHKNQGVSRMELFAHGWDEQAEILNNNVDVYVLFLRKKLIKSTATIETIKGFGYKLCDP